MPGTGEMRGSIEEALAEAGVGSEGLLPNPSEGSPDSDGGTVGTGETPPADAAESEAVDDGTEEAAPETYWGISLEGIPDEQRAAIVARLEQQDSRIQTLQQRMAQEPPAPEAVEPEPPVELTDDDILRAIGIDPEQADQFELEYARKHTLPLARQIINLEDTVENLRESDEVRSTQTFWNSELDRLEGEYGALPFDRVRVLQYAAEEGIPHPEMLYFRLSAPVRKSVDEEIARVRKESLKREAQGGVRPRSTAGGTKSLDTDGKSLRDIVKEAAVQAQEETGRKWSDVLLGR